MLNKRLSDRGSQLMEPDESAQQTYLKYQRRVSGAGVNGMGGKKCKV